MGSNFAVFFLWFPGKRNIEGKLQRKVQKKIEMGLLSRHIYSPTNFASYFSSLFIPTSSFMRQGFSTFEVAPTEINGPETNSNCHLANHFFSRLTVSGLKLLQNE